MSTVSLQHFCNRVTAAGVLTPADLRILSRELLADGIVAREEADLLLALDRAVADKADAFAGFVIATVVDFAVWGQRPTGTITRETADWLAGSIGGRAGPTRTGALLAREIVREAHLSDEALVAFAFKANDWSRRAAGERPVQFALAA